MFGQIVTQFFRYLLQSGLDYIVFEFCNPTTFDTNDVIVVITRIQFKNRLSAIKMMPGYQPGCFKLRQDPINRRQSDIRISVQQSTINILCAHMMLSGIFQYLQNFYTWQGNLEAGFF